MLSFEVSEVSSVSSYEISTEKRLLTLQSPDRRGVHWDPDVIHDPKSYRHAPRQGDFEIESLQVEDLLV